MLYLGADHRGFKLKEKLKEWLTSKKIKFKDLGALKFDPGDDYPDIAKKVAEKVVLFRHPEQGIRQPAERLVEGSSDLAKSVNKGVLICGSGGGVCIAANKIKGVRAGIGFRPQQVRKMVEDDDLNILCLASDYTTKFKAFQLTKIFLNSKFAKKKRFLRRIKKIRLIGG